MKYKISIYKVLWLLGFLFLLQNSHADNRVLLSGNWKFQYGDKPEWSKVDFDDSSWSNIKVPSLVKQKHNTPINGWYRLKFDAHVDIDEPQALLIESIRHSDETWINNIRVGGKGTFEKPWHFMQTNPVELVRLYQIPAGFLKEKDNVLAIRTNIGFGQAQGAMFPGGAGIQRGHVYLGEPDYLGDYVQKKLMQITAIDVVFFTLGFIEIFIILFLLRTSIHIFPEFNWLLFTSVVMLLGSIGHDFFYIHGFHWISVNLLLIIALLFMPLSVALYFWAQYQNVSTKLVQYFVSLWAIVSLYILIPSISDLIKIYLWYVWIFLAIIFFAYALFCALHGVYIKRIGAYMQLLGLVIFLISIRTQWLPDTFWGHRNVQIGSLIYRYTLLFAYFQKIKRMQMDYKDISKRVVKIADDIYANIARELHDGMGQHLASMKLQTKLASIQTQNKHLKNINAELDASISGLRRLLAGLHPVLVDKYDLATALTMESQYKEKIHGVRINLVISELNLDKNLEHQIFRIYQECLTNAIQHGEAGIIQLRLYQKNNKIILSIKDNGKGFDDIQPAKYTKQTGLGLVSLKERISLLNGQLSINSKHYQGTEILISIPLY